MKQKIVIQMELRDGKCRSKAMQVASLAYGVTSVAIEGEGKDRVVVVGDGVDSTELTNSLRKKIGYASLETVEEVKPKVDQVKIQETVQCYYDQQPIIQCGPSYYQYPVYESNPPNCSIM